MLVLYTESELARSSNFYGATQNYVTREECVTHYVQSCIVCSDSLFVASFALCYVV